MKKLFISLTISIFLLTTNYSFAQKVSIDDLKLLVPKVLKEHRSENKKVEKFLPIEFEKDTVLYIASLTDGGFIILSSDYRTPPVLGYCTKGIYNPAILPEGLTYLIDTYKKSVKSCKEKSFEVPEETKSAWDKYLSKEEVSLKSESIIEEMEGVSNMLPTEWGQGEYHQTGSGNQSHNFNRFCPPGCLAGCVAVAMAQILYYWKWDVDQRGSNTSNGVTINFYAWDYCWDSMSLYSSDINNSRLIYHAGISCDTEYCDWDWKSKSDEDKALHAFKNFWGMNSGAEVKRRMLITLWPTWKNRLKNELLAGRPILYAGGKHVWVIDGYLGDNFNCNWGWDGDYNGPYSLGGFNPSPVYDFNSDENAIFGLYPETNVLCGVSGPDVLTSDGARYDIENTADCNYASWSYSPNIQSYYGSTHWIALKAIGNGVGWIDASYIIDGQVRYAPRKYVTCVP